MAHKVIGYSYFGLKTIHMEKDLGIPKQSMRRRGSFVAWRKPAVPATRCRHYITIHARSSFPAWYLTGGATYWLVMLPSNRIGGCVSWTPWTSPLLGKSWLQVHNVISSGKRHQFGNILPWIFFERTLFTSFHVIWESPPVQQEDKRNLHLLLEQLRFWRSSDKSF